LEKTGNVTHNNKLTKLEKTAFSLNIGNLPPNAEANIELVYIKELSFTDNKQLQLVLPAAKQSSPEFPNTSITVRLGK
jgi:hypothetical protein